MSKMRQMRTGPELFENSFFGQLLLKYVTSSHEIATVKLQWHYQILKRRIAFLHRLSSFKSIFYSHNQTILKSGPHAILLRGKWDNLKLINQKQWQRPCKIQKFSVLICVEINTSICYIAEISYFHLSFSLCLHKGYICIFLKFGKNCFFPFQKNKEYFTN